MNDLRIWNCSQYIYSPNFELMRVGSIWVRLFVVQCHHRRNSQTVAGMTLKVLGVPTSASTVRGSLNSMMQVLRSMKCLRFGQAEVDETHVSPCLIIGDGRNRPFISTRTRSSLNATAWIRPFLLRPCPPNIAVISRRPRRPLFLVSSLDTFMPYSILEFDHWPRAVPK